MIRYYKVNQEKWNNGWHYDYKLKEAYPMVEMNKIYKCISILESDTPDTVLRVILDEEEDNFIYVPSWVMIPIEVIRDETINRILDENRDK